jgi:hypothetical protein
MQAVQPETDAQEEQTGQKRDPPLRLDLIETFDLDTVARKLMFIVVMPDRNALLDLRSAWVELADEQRPAHLSRIEQFRFVPGVGPLRRLAVEAQRTDVRFAAQAEGIAARCNASVCPLRCDAVDYRQSLRGESGDFGEATLWQRRAGRTTTPVSGPRYMPAATDRLTCCLLFHPCAAP